MTSVILCFMGALFGVFALIKWFCILKPNVYTNIYNVIPIVVTTIAWLSAAVTFYQTETYNSPIDIQRFFMVLGVAGLIWRIKVYRESSHKKDAIIKAQRDTINHLTAN
ncbi:hypothetical protein HG532_00700 [Moraxella osloensis]|nr:hypothetical protein [Moraxella osloensis]MBW4008549.1 hypothetical protein [Moraxella osloensis]